MQPHPAAPVKREHARSPKGAGRRADLLICAIGLAWMGYGMMGLAAHPPVLVAALAAVIGSVWLLAGAGKPVIRASAPLPDLAPGVRVRWAGFVLTVIGEIALLNLVLVLLQAFDVVRLLVPAISAVVGLHFVPLAWLFGRRDLYWLALAMLAGTAATVVAIVSAPELTTIAPRIEGIANGAMLILVRMRMRRT